MNMNNKFITKTYGIYRTSFFLLKTLFRSPKVYIFNLIIPTLLTLVIYYLWNKLGNEMLYPPNLFSFMMIGTIINGFFFGLYFIDWKRTIYFQRIKTSGKSKTNLIISLSISFLLINLLQFTLTTIIFLIFTSLSKDKNQFEMIFKLDWYIGLFFLFSLILLNLLVISMNIMFVQFTNNIKVNRSILIILLILNLLFTSTLITSNVAETIPTFTYIGYLIPIKYAIWNVNYIVSYTFLDHEGIYQMINYSAVNGLKIDIFYNLGITICGSTLFILSFYYLVIKTFKWNLKE